jgi:hypothetical protein
LKVRGALVGIVAGAVVAAKSSFHPPNNSDASAIFPTPTPHSEKKCRRVILRSSAAFLA